MIGKLLAILLVGAVVLTAARTAATEPAVPSRLEISMPEQMGAGASVTAEITAAPGVVARVVFTSGYRSTVREVRFGSATEHVTVPFTRFAGRIDAVVIAGQLLAGATLVVEPGPPAEPPTPLLGARSIVADGRDRAMVVVIPSDQFGNPSLRPTDLAISVVHPDASRYEAAPRSSRTLQWMWVPAVTSAGSGSVTSVLGGIAGPSRALLEVPGPPSSFELVADTEHRPADGSSLVTVASGVLRDDNGNPMLDGTAAVVRAEYPDGTTSIQTVVTIGGIARASLEAPSQPGSVFVSMTVRGTTGRVHEVVFEPAAAAVSTGTAPTTTVTIRPTGSRP
jgi:hypothetical protein